MAAHPKFIRQKPLDIWTTHEKLMLSSSVLLSGDQNWVSVSRAIKNQSQENRPPEYFSQKNCALQYGELLEHAETPKRKKSEKNEVIPVETQGMIIVNKLRTKYMEELVTEIKQQQEAYLKLEDEIEMVNSGHCDGQLAEIWEQIQKKLRENDPEEVPPTTQTETVTETTSDTQTVTQSTGEPVVLTADTVSTSMEVEDTTAQDSPSQEPHIEVDDNPQDVPTITEEPTVPPLIIKVPEKSQRQPSATPTKTVTSERSEDQPTPKKSVSSPVKETPVIALETTKPKTRQHSGAGDGGSDKGTTPRTKPEAKLVAKLEPAPPAEPERVTPVPPEKPTSLTVTAETTSEIERSDSPVSTVSSVSEVTKKKIKTPTTSHQTPSSQTSGAASGSLRRSGRVVKTVAKEEKDKKEEVVTPKATPSVTKSASEVELSSDEEEKDEDEDDDDEEAEEEDDEEMEEEDDVASTSKHHDSAPDSPSVTHSDVEDDKYHKAWKKSIMLVWRQIAHHKFGNVFMDKVTDEIAPGYSLCINRPMSLSLIKQNIEKNVIRTTEEFTRDIMLMFVNAIMYNNHEYDVYVMAQEMYDAAMKSIEQHTQTMVKETEAKPISLRGRKSDVSLSSDKESDKSRRRSSAEQQLDSSHGSTGRRKTRADI